MQERHVVIFGAARSSTDYLVYDTRCMLALITRSTVSDFPDVSREYVPNFTLEIILCTCRVHSEKLPATFRCSTRANVFSLKNYLQDTWHAACIRLPYANDLESTNSCFQIVGALKFRSVVCIRPYITVDEGRAGLGDVRRKCASAALVAAAQVRRMLLVQHRL